MLMLEYQPSGEGLKFYSDWNPEPYFCPLGSAQTQEVKACDVSRYLTLAAE